MPRSLADLALSCSVLPKELAKAQKDGVRSVALHVTTEIRSNIRGITGDMKLSGVGKSGATVGAGFDIKGVVDPTAVIRAKGPLQLIENDSEPHDIYPRKNRPAGVEGSKRSKNSGSVGRGKKALKTPYGIFGKVHHGGTRGQRPFARGVDATAPDAGRIYNLAVGKAIKRSFT